MGKRKIRANIVSWTSGGLGKDIDILVQALSEAGCDVWFKGHDHKVPRNRIDRLLFTFQSLFNRFRSKFTNSPIFDINFHIESIFPEYLSLSRVNTLIVNPEWFRKEIYAYLDNLDLILCKTQDAVRVTDDLAAESRFIGFTSEDRELKGTFRASSIECLHIAGQSMLKGTDAVIEVWKRHPEWPKLNIVKRSLDYGGNLAPPPTKLPNVHYYTNYIPDNELRVLQNRCQIHVQPSLAEGYGHVLGEAMSCRAVVVTTDAPPMNELIQNDRGILVNISSREPKDLSYLNHVDLEDLERKLESSFKMTVEEIQSLGSASRAWYDTHSRKFKNELKHLIEGLSKDGSNSS